MQITGITGRQVLARLLVLVAGLAAVATPARAQLRLDITEGVNDAVPVAVVPFGGQAEGGCDRHRGRRRRRPALERAIRAARSPGHGDPAHQRRPGPLRGLAPAQGRLPRGRSPGRRRDVAVVVRTVQRADRPAAARRDDPGVRAEPARGGAPHFGPGVRAADRHPGRVLDAHRLRRRSRASRRRSATGWWSPMPTGSTRAPWPNRASRSCRRPGRRTGRAWRTCPSRPRPRRSTCSGSRPASGDACRRGRASTARRHSRPTARASRSRSRATATSTSTCSTSRPRRSPGSRPTTRSTPKPRGRRTGRALYFTSDRAGNAQIYRVSLAEPSDVQRVTYTNAYNARPRLSPDGTALAMVTLDRGLPHRAAWTSRPATCACSPTAARTSRRASRRTAPSSSTRPRTAARVRSRWCRSDGRYQERLSSSQGDVREPAWSPYPPR